MYHTLRHALAGANKWHLRQIHAQLEKQTFNNSYRPDAPASVDGSAAAPCTQEQLQTLRCREPNCVASQPRLEESKEGYFVCPDCGVEAPGFRADARDEYHEGAGDNEERVAPPRMTAVNGLASAAPPMRTYRCDDLGTDDSLIHKVTPHALQFFFFSNSHIQSTIGTESPQSPTAYTR